MSQDSSIYLGALPQIAQHFDTFRESLASLKHDTAWTTLAADVAACDRAVQALRQRMETHELLTLAPVAPSLPSQNTDAGDAYQTDGMEADVSPSETAFSVHSLLQDLPVELAGGDATVVALARLESKRLVELSSILEHALASSAASRGSIEPEPESLRISAVKKGVACNCNHNSMEIVRHINILLIELFLSRSWMTVHTAQSRIALAMQIRYDMNDAVNRTPIGLSRGTPSRASLSPVSVNVTASGELFLSSIGDD